MKNRTTLWCNNSTPGYLFTEFLILVIVFYNSGAIVYFIFIVVGALLTFFILHLIFLNILCIILLKFVFNNFIIFIFLHSVSAVQLCVHVFGASAVFS